MKITDIKAKISGIYEIIFPNDKIYIGCAVDIKRRIKEHYNKQDNTPCQKALFLYYEKPEDIEFEILFVQEIQNLEELKDKEIYYINKFNACDRTIGYNLTSGGDGADYGVNNVASKITQEELDIIVELLKDGKSNVEIGERFKLHPDTIGRINVGKTYYNENLNYPIREIPIPVSGFINGNSFKKEKYLEAIKLIKQGIPIIKISEMLGISRSLLSKINKGNHFICKEVDEEYPLYKYGRISCPLSEKEIEGIKKDLLNPNLSTQDIADKYNTSRDTVSDINQGKRHRDENSSYPIRTFYPKTRSKKPVSTILESEEQGFY